MTISVQDAIQTRRSMRSFSSRDVELKVLLELLSLSHRSPSGFNLQPWHYIVVQDKDLRQLLAHAALDQRQVKEAPATVVFLADPYCWKERYDTILQESVQRGVYPQQVADFYRSMTYQFFRTGPLGLFGLIKRLAIPLRRLRTPTPHVVTSYEESMTYARLQTMLSAMSFMLAARGADLHTSPMEGFDEQLVKKLLNIPKNLGVQLLVSVGYPLDSTPLVDSYRLPLSSVTSINVFGNSIRDDSALS